MKQRDSDAAVYWLLSGPELPLPHGSIIHKLGEKEEFLACLDFEKALITVCVCVGTRTRGSAQIHSHAHKGTTRAIVSIGAGHGNNVIKRIWGDAFRAFFLASHILTAHSQKKISYYIQMLF